MAQFAVKDSTIRQVLLAFFVFIILTSPQFAGQEVRSFLGWLGGALDAVLVFLDGALGEPSS